MAEKTLVPITEKALYQRINRKLHSRGEVLKRARGNVWLTLGEYFVVDVQSNAVVSHHVDIEDHAREIGALAAWECLSKPSES